MGLALFWLNCANDPMSDDFDGKPSRDFSFLFLLMIIGLIAWYGAGPIGVRIQELYQYLLHAFGG
jgi:hypothetical protein